MHAPRNSFGWDSKDRSGPQPGFDFIFVDEAHHARPKHGMNFFSLPGANRVVYLTATPFRTDRRRIKAQLIYSYDIDRAVEDGIYQTVDFEQVKVGIGGEVDVVEVEAQAHGMTSAVIVLPVLERGLLRT